MSSSNGCPRCTAPVDPADDAGQLLLRFPTEHTFAKGQAHLRAGGARVRRDGDVLEVAVAAGALLGLLRGLESVLEVGERGATRTLFVPDGKQLSRSDYLEVEPIDRHVGRLEGRWLSAMIRAEAFTSVFQPIVALGDRLGIAGFECLVRGVRGDELVSPGEMIAVAGRADMLSAFDHAARRSAVRCLSRFPDLPAAFINVSPRAIYDSVTCLEPTVEQLDAIAYPHDRVVFEVIESDYADPRLLGQIMSFYRAKGFRVALDDLGAGFGSFALLESLRPDIIKIDIQFIRGVDRDPYRAAIASKLIETAHALGILAVAEGIETPGELAWARAHGADFAQGFLLGRPAATPQLEPAPV